MKKVAFLVESTFEMNHFGVRNYFSALKNVLDENHIVEFISYRMSISGIKWYKVFVRYIKNNDTVEKQDRQLKTNRHNTIKFNNLEKHLEEMPKQEKRYYYQYIGDSLKQENYDLCVITNPWCINANVKIDAKKIIGLVYDLIPNTYAFNKAKKDFDWGYMHNIGYKYYNDHCDKILAISDSIAEQYKQMYPNVCRDKVSYIKPFVTFGFENACATYKKEENAVILAAPFDLRKGLLSIPKILNELDDYIDRIYIFGVPRCSQKHFEDFFKAVDCNKVVYYPKISQEKLILLYKKCKIMLFPSLDEGLGLPILEAQICGCRVVTTDKEPMNKLVLDGSYLLTKDFDNDIENMKKILNDDDFDFKKLSEKAKEKFLYEGIENEFIY